MEDVTLEDVRRWDEADPLRPFRDRFALPPDTVYLDGNSLGALPRATLDHQQRLLREEWGNDLIRSWDTNGWLAAPARVGDKIARVVGARPGEVIVADSTSVNLFKLLVAAVRARPGRHVILTEAGDFPTDRHIAEGVAALLPGMRVRAVAAAELPAALDGDVAVLLLSHVHYSTGAAHDMAALSAAARAAGALNLWDLSHSAGAIAVNLTRDGADFAVGCGYKFLNGGPGAPAYLYVSTALQEVRSPLQGWMGDAAPFAFGAAYSPAPGIARFLCGTPPMLSLTALESGVDVWLAADPAQTFAKSARLFEMFAHLVTQRCSGSRLDLITPEAAHLRGSHIAFRHPDAGAIMRRVIDGGVIGDYRPPDVLRFGLTPLYVSFADVWAAVEALGTEVKTGGTAPPQTPASI